MQGAGTGPPLGFFVNFIKRILSEHFSISVAVCLSLRHIVALNLAKICQQNDVGDIERHVRHVVKLML